MAAAEEFCESYLLVNAKEASLYDLACILTCSTSFLNTKKFYDEQSEHVGRSSGENIWRRLVIFASILAQKFLIWADKPMAKIGSLIEIWLNLLSSNGGFFGFLINHIRGKVVRPEESPEKFVSFIGKLDDRLKLDTSIKKGDGRYNSSLSMMAAKLSYENEAFVRAAIQDQLKVT
ncbi:triacylglycerol lipase OBL1-like [Bidens hawaiensis]|uniref:triacylglycerol lipase OBL1-like n=1 Tax=Bidens hawaiensis TaxID=980011 RepID=UPI00404B0EFB